MSSLEHRPYLREGAVGNEFQLPAFLALVGCIAVVGLWLYSARGLLGSFWHFATGQISVVQTVEFEPLQYDAGSIYAAATAPAGDEDAAPREVWSPSSDCVVEVSPCTVEVVMAARFESGCLAVCK